MNVVDAVVGAEKPARRRAAARKPAAKKQAKTLYDVAIKNGWGDSLRTMPKVVAHLKRKPA